MISVNNPRNAVFVPVTRRQFSLWWLQVRSAPVTLQVLGTGAAPRGEKTPGPWLVRAPENHRYPAQVQVVHGRAQRRAVCSQISGLRSSRAQPTRCGSLAGASRSHTLLLRGGRVRWRECLGAQSDLVADRQPRVQAHRGMPGSVQAKARSTSKSLPSRRMW
jgi:hypothetical protein